jgi:hypothetical protein
MLGQDDVNGYVLLAAIFFVSCGTQVWHAWTTFREEVLETYRHPCLVRWVEYVLTVPLQVARPLDLANACRPC